MRATESSRAILRRAFRRLEHEVPGKVAHVLRNLRHPNARMIRIPVGVLLVLGGIFSILPFLGIWMLPLGLLLIAYDVPFLRRPVARFTLWAIHKWEVLRERFFPALQNKRRPPANVPGATPGTAAASPPIGSPAPHREPSRTERRP